MPVPSSYDPIKAGCIDGSGDFIHDKAVLRAVRTSYCPNERVVGNPEKTIFVGRLDPSTEEITVRTFFQSYGTINNCRLVRNIVTGTSRRYAFVEFKHTSDAQKAAEKAHNAIIDSSKIIVEMEMERVVPGWKPRRLGGGLGGDKRSGQLRFGGKERPFKVEKPREQVEETNLRVRRTRR